MAKERALLGLALIFMVLGNAGVWFPPAWLLAPAYAPALALAVTLLTGAAGVLLVTRDWLHAWLVGVRFPDLRTNWRLQKILAGVTAGSPLEGRVVAWVEPRWRMNAGVLGSRSIAVAPALMQLENGELAAVLAHEFGHLIRPWELVVKGFVMGVSKSGKVAAALLAEVTVIAGAYFARSLYWDQVARWITRSLLLWALFVVPSLALAELLWRAWWRKGEYHADAFVARLGLGAELAAVLPKLDRINGRPAKRTSLFDSHPATFERVERLRSLSGGVAAGAGEPESRA
ncbi:MAG: M48 family metalloprotease [Bacillota bacterium]|nr:M48 family metalloprotease [Bacillota bacterium]